MPGLRLRARPGLPLASLIALAAGLALSLAFPPAGLWPIAFVAIAPLLWLLDGSGPGRGALLGALYGLGCYGTTIYWIWRFGELAWVSLTLVMALSLAIVGLLYPAVRRPGRPLVTAVGVAALWTLLDWLRGLWPLGGFTWGSVGVSQVDNRITVRVATLAGVWGVTFAVVLVNALVLAAIRGRGARTRAVPAVIAIAVLVAPLAIPFGEATGPAVDVATVQVDVREAARDTATGEDRRVAALNVDAHRTLAGAARPDLIVWGEGALDPAAAADPAVITQVRSAIASVGVPTLVGAVTSDADGRQRTAVLLFDGEGNPIGRYDKVHLVPFGEYVPFRSRLSWIDAIDQVPVDRAPGERIHTLEAPGVPPFGTPICFENSFPELPRAFVRAGAGFLIVTVNNASYGFTAASAQHQQMSRMRAIETGRWVVNAAVSGISAFIDPSGRVVTTAGLFEPAILRATIRSSDERTWYVRLGDWLPWLCLALVAVLFVAPPRRRRPSRTAPRDLAPGSRTLVILPTYDEAPTIERVLDGILDAPQSVDVLVVDDSSPDGTGTLVRARAEADGRVRLIEREAKSGLASAYLEGFRLGLREGYDLVVEMDSDLSHDPAELPGLLEAARGHDLTVGSRYVPGGSVSNWSRSRLALSHAGNRYARFMLGVPTRDATSGYRVYRRDLLAALVADPVRSEGYGFQIELVMRAWQLGFDLGEAPITFRERAHGHSKISRRIVVEALWLVTVWGLRARLRGSSPSRRPADPEAG